MDFKTSGNLTRHLFNMNPDLLSQKLATPLPRTQIEKPAFIEKNKQQVIQVQEEEIISNYLVEHFQDIGGWKAKSYLKVEDIHKAPNFTHHIPIEVQKFEFQEKTLPESIFKPRPEPDYSQSFYSSFKESKNLEVGKSLEDLKEQEKKIVEEKKEKEKKEEKEGKIRRLEQKIMSGGEEVLEERMIKLKTRNKKVLAMVDDLMSRAQKRRAR
jgi:hypothetical protein